MGAFFEAHIEQGPILETKRKPLASSDLGKVFAAYNIEVIGPPLSLWHHANALA